MAIAMAITAQSAAAQCSGFTDVDAAHPLCPNVDWLRNRAVTLGCTSTTLYCPNAAVVRLSMAAFMNRLGNALTPAFSSQQGNGTALALSTVVCSTGDVAAATYPRSASVIGTVTSQVAAPANAAMHVVVSTNGGATWATVTQAPPALAGPAGWITGAVQKSTIPVAANAVVRFGIRLDPTPGSAALASWTCDLKARLASRTGSGVPY